MNGMIGLCLVLVFGLFRTFGAAKIHDVHGDYGARCTVALDNENSSSGGLDCRTALFSDFSFNVSGNLLMTHSDLCLTVPNRVNVQQIVVVRRGNCSFETKARNAATSGYKALIVLDDEPPFPMGSSDAVFVAIIPVVMMQSDPSFQNSSGKEASLSYVSRRQSAKPKHGSSGPFDVVDTVNSLFLTLAVLVFGSFVWTQHKSIGNFFSTRMRTVSNKGANSVCAADDQASLSTSSSSFQDSCLHLAMLAILSLLFILMRLGTFRVLGTVHSVGSTSGSQTGTVEYNHRETDEMIFQNLFNYVYANITDYTLQNKPIIAQYNLAPENYNDALFIHPPLFVYLSMVLTKYCGLPIPALSIVYQLIGFWTVPFVVAHVVGPVSQIKNSCGAPNTQSDLAFDTHSITYSTMLVLVFCPLTVLCSQKVWIDNCLFMCTCLCVLGHMYLIDGTGNRNWTHQSQGIDETAASLCKSRPSSIYLQCLTSGVVCFGFVAMYCKITSVFLLPFLLGWICLQRYSAMVSQHNPQRRPTIRSIAWSGAIHCSVFLAGACIAYAPWAIIYYTFTGRMSPNAWPSATMLRNSLFVRTAVNKPLNHYLAVLAEFSPCHMLAILFCVLLGVKFLWHIATVACVRQKSNRIQNSATAVPVDSDISSCGQLEALSHTDLFLVARIVVFSLWPATYLFCLTLLGGLGAGFQSRFLLPVVPATAILCAIGIHWPMSVCTKQHLSSASASARVTHVLFNLCVAYSAMQAVYSGILYAPLYAELTSSLRHVLINILTHAYHAPLSRESYRETVKCMAHYGFKP